MARWLKRPHRRSLRRHAFGIALAVVVSPLVLVLGTNWFETLFGQRALESLHQTRDTIFTLYEQGASDEEVRTRIEELARSRTQYVRVLDESGTPRLSVDAWIGESWYDPIGDLFYGPDRKEAQRAWELERGPVERRLEAQDAKNLGSADGCYFSTPGNLYICAAGAWIERPDGLKRLIHVQGSTRRALQALYESRRQLLKLGLFTLALALMLAWWTLARMVRPVEHLREEVLRRATEAVPRAGIDIGRRDELGDLADAFNTVLLALGERNRTNEAFLADLAHELKNPVAAVRACAERLPATRPDDPARLQRLADVLHQSAGRLDALVTQLLELARAEAGLHNEQRDRIELLELLRALCHTTQEDPRYQEVRVELVAPAQPIELMGVADRIESALRNLLDNAASFAGPGGWVRVEVDADAHRIVIRVKDSGSGIAPEDLPRVFDRFFTTRRDSRGTGLGLSLARAVVEAHGGRIEVESLPGQGAEFSVLLPRVPLVALGA
ncbi:HAMP domain-containing sensor histidine kinase [Hyalangium sp.]|uniref:sensor histidine kinase n=1 Tax=Hyalangium sp. TaxID=2028555 RepID=UPI002D4055AD|nr:HAMP domain-containing sensor histidine kinase [Hyalangium sp.]HYI02308.1 HAMP domain-containing sensor histidine kinase [Hyalangium sp.]